MPILDLLLLMSLQPHPFFIFFRLTLLICSLRIAAPQQTRGGPCTTHCFGVSRYTPKNSPMPQGTGELSAVYLDTPKQWVVPRGTPLLLGGSKRSNNYKSISEERNVIETDNVEFLCIVGPRNKNNRQCPWALLSFWGYTLTPPKTG